MRARIGYWIAASCCFLAACSSDGAPESYAHPLSERVVTRSVDAGDPFVPGALTIGVDAGSSTGSFTIRERTCWWDPEPQPECPLPGRQPTCPECGSCAKCSRFSSDGNAWFALTLNPSFGLSAIDLRPFVVVGTGTPYAPSKYTFISINPAQVIGGYQNAVVPAEFAGEQNLYVWFVKRVGANGSLPLTGTLVPNPL